MSHGIVSRHRGFHTVGSTATTEDGIAAGALNRAYDGAGRGGAFDED